MNDNTTTPDQKWWEISSESEDEDGVIGLEFLLEEGDMEIIHRVDNNPMALLAMSGRLQDKGVPTGEYLDILNWGFFSIPEDEEEPLNTEPAVAHLYFMDPV